LSEQIKLGRTFAVISTFILNFNGDVYLVRLDTMKFFLPKKVCKNIHVSCGTGEEITKQNSEY
jgi:hypothetical protein